MIRGCAEQDRLTKLDEERVPEPNWISPEIIEAYTDLFQAGKAHSVEVWKDGQLVAGLYGTFIDGIFAGESMFYKEKNAAKLALYDLILRLKSKGHIFMDTQMSIGLVEKWGGKYIARAEFLELKKSAAMSPLGF